MSTQGVIYFNSGLSCLVRLAVSASSLRGVYTGPATILCDKLSLEHCQRIGKLYGLDVKEIDVERLTKNTALLNKCRMHEVTPYDTTVFIDADTLIFRNFSYLFNLAEKFSFVATQFCEWTTKDKKIRQRIEQWDDVLPESLCLSTQKASEFGPAINTGVFAFNKESELMLEWYEVALKGVRFFIPDEISCQIMIANNYLNYVTDRTYNESCKYGKLTDTTKIMHFHGRKHCRVTDKGVPLNNSELWFSQFSKIRDKVSDLIPHDRHLVRYLPIWDKYYGGAK